MAEINELEVQLESRSLLGFQLDASHLHDLLKAIIRQQGQQQQQTNRRLQQIENAITDLDRRASKLEGGAGDDGGLRQLQMDVRGLAQAVDGMQRQGLPELKRVVEENRARGINNERALQTFNIRPVEQQLQQQSAAIDQLVRQLPQVQREVEEVKGRQGNQERGLSEALREAQQKIGALDRDVGAIQTHLANMPQSDGRQWKDALDELNGRMNENFRIVEQSANAVDVELGKLRTDLANLRAEVNTFDNNTRYRLGKITDDVDEKFKMLLDTLRAFETNSSEMQEALTTAGAALARSRQNRMNALSQYSAGLGAASNSPSSYAPSNRETTTTNTNLRPGGYLQTDQYSVPGSARRGVSGGW